MMLFMGSLLVSFDLMHEIKNMKKLKVDGAQVTVETTHLSYSELNDSDSVWLLVFFIQ